MQQSQMSLFDEVYDDARSAAAPYSERLTEMDIPPGDVMTTFDDETLEKVVLIGTGFGTIALRERFTDDGKVEYVGQLPQSFPSKVMRWFKHLTDRKIETLLALRNFGGREFNLLDTLTRKGLVTLH